MLLYVPRVFRKEEEPLLGETSRQNEVGKTEVKKPMVALSALSKEHQRPGLEPTFEVIPNPWDTECLARMFSLGAIEMVTKYDNRPRFAPNATSYPPYLPQCTPYYLS